MCYSLQRTLCWCQESTLYWKWIFFRCFTWKLLSVQKIQWRGNRIPIWSQKSFNLISLKCFDNFPSQVLSTGQTLLWSEYILTLQHLIRSLKIRRSSLLIFYLLLEELWDFSLGSQSSVEWRYFTTLHNSYLIYSSQIKLISSNQEPSNEIIFMNDWQFLLWIMNYCVSTLNW